MKEERGRGGERGRVYHGSVAEIGGVCDILVLV